MDTGITGFLVAMSLVLTVFFLTPYILGLYYGARLLTRARFFQRHCWFTWGLIFVVAVAAGTFFSRLGDSSVVQVGGAVCGFLVHFIPPLMGYWSARQDVAKADALTRERRTWTWLMEWERNRLVRTGEYED